MNEFDEQIAQRLQAVCARIDAACARAGRNPQEVTLMLATKTVPAEQLAAAARAGFVLFGENRVQEARFKARKLAEIAPDLALQVRWHMIGHLQTNKIKPALSFADTVQSVDRPRLIDRLAARLAAVKRCIGVYVQVNTTGKATQYGVDPDNARMLVEAVQAAPNLALKGLMTIGNLGASAEVARPNFVALRRLRDRLRADGILQAGQDGLSMGMSSDFEIAIEEGATLVRVGTAVFGQRPTPDSYYWPEGPAL
ncbi:MAG: YggS family pyridoxal phosphate-dependent enzyme [Gammaproteobacteria bacterium HGW-Gammaproteobacteria-8]|nr:MAG: YggS family pyridoxal phosphate-dependent enzyme [Gammaproteobacteria bacterium HGW-Gammaproteobacteria-8]